MLFKFVNGLNRPDFPPAEFRSENLFSTNFKTQQKGEIVACYQPFSSGAEEINWSSTKAHTIKFTIKFTEVLHLWECYPEPSYKQWRLSELLPHGTFGPLFENYLIRATNVYLFVFFPTGLSYPHFSCSSFS